MLSRILALIVVIAAFCNLTVNAGQNLRNDLIQPNYAKKTKIMGDVEFARKFPNQTDTSPRLLSDTAESYPSDPLGYASLYLSEFAYCSNGGNFMNLDFSGVSYVQDFVPAAQFAVGSDGSITGFIGYQPSVSTIWVAFRGSSDIANWITNLDFIRMSYPLCSGCSVHEGFYTAEQQALPQIQNAVQQLVAAYPSYSIVVTGHSLGAALATLTALDLAQTYGSGVSVYNYGCPRIFNQAGANWASGGAVYIGARRTHYQDIVPHLPQEIFGFVHTNGEIYEGGPISSYPNFPGGPLQTCSGEEDPNCADQWDGTSIADHLLYSGVALGSGGCQYIMPGMQTASPTTASPTNAQPTTFAPTTFAPTTSSPTGGS